MADYAAAWVPDDDPERDWDIAANWAADWVLEQPGRPLVITNAKNGLEQQIPGLRRVAARGDHATPRSNMPRRYAGGRPVLAYVPHWKELEFGIEIAGSAALCLVETRSCRMNGWAAEIGAINLATGKPTPPVETPGFSELLDSLEFAGNNGYADDYGKRDARVLLKSVAARAVDPAAILGGLAARGISPEGVKRIETMLKR